MILNRGALTIVLASTLLLTGCAEMDLKFQSESAQAKAVIQDISTLLLDGYSFGEPSGGVYGLADKNEDWTIAATKTGASFAEECPVAVHYAIQIGATRYLGLPEGNTLPKDEKAAADYCVEALGVLPDAEAGNEVASGAFTLLGDHNGTKMLVEFVRRGTPSDPSIPESFQISVRTDVSGDETEMTG